MNNLDKKVLQDLGQNTGFNAKMYFKSHDLVQVIQFLALFLPPTFGIISLSFCGLKIFDVLALIFSIFALVYFISFGKNQESYMEWGEKYLELYHKIEIYYKRNLEYDSQKIIEFEMNISELNKQRRPAYHIFSKIWVDKKMDKEFTNGNETKPWYK